MKSMPPMTLFQRTQESNLLFKLRNIKDELRHRRPTDFLLRLLQDCLLNILATSIFRDARKLSRTSLPYRKSNYIART